MYREHLEPEGKKSRETIFLFLYHDFGELKTKSWHVYSSWQYRKREDWLIF